MTRWSSVKLALVAGFVLAGCGSNINAKPSGPRLVTFGHSFVAGRLAVNKHVTPWPEQAARVLHVGLQNRAHKGDVSAQTLKIVKKYQPYATDTVIIEAEINDVRLDADLGLRQYAKNLREMITDARGARRIIVASDPPIVAWSRYAPFNHGSVASLKDFAAATRQVARQAGARFVDLAPGWNSSQTGGDGIHPNAVGTARIAQLIERAAR